jgi:hypothetical protein
VNGAVVDKRIGRRAAAVLVAAVLAGALLVGGQGAGAADTRKAATAKAADGTLTWGVSGYALGANPSAMSLSEVHVAEAPATFVAGTGWQFEDGAGTYDAKTGAMTISFPGALEFGNTSFGNYGFKFAQPTVTLDASGNGTLSADVSVRGANGAAFGAPSKIVIANLSDATPTKTKKHVTVTVTPTGFADPLIIAAGELSPFFKATGSTNDAIKAPAPATVAFAYKAKSKS